MSGLGLRSINSVDNDKRFIQAIYQHCPNLRYLKLSLNNDSIIELEKLLINCQFLNELAIDIIYESRIFNSWVKLFEILVKYSPISLFRFKFYFHRKANLKDIKLFHNNWKDRHPMVLEIRQCLSNF